MITGTRVRVSIKDTWKLEKPVSKTQATYRDRWIDEIGPKVNLLS